LNGLSAITLWETIMSETLSYKKDEYGGVFIGHLPVAKPRMTQRDQWKKRPIVQRYRAFCDVLNIVNNRLGGRVKEILETGQVSVVFFLPIPKRRKEKEGDPHQVRPDIDNFVKSVFDAICDDDSHIFEVKARKQYTEGQPGIYISDL